MRALALLVGFAALPVNAFAAESCAPDHAWECLHEGDAAQARGDRSAALAAYTTACGANLLDGCLGEGRLRLSLGDLSGAEPPLRRVQEEDRADGYAALADLYDARAQPAEARELRWEGLAIEQPDAEFVGSYRAGLSTDTRSLAESYVLDLRIHPMAFDARRVTFGAEFVVGHAGEEVFGMVGLQHFVTDWLILYGDALVGSRTAGFPLDAGVQGGVELAAGALGHLEVGVGSTFGNALYVSVGLGLNWIVALDAALHAA